MNSAIADYIYDGVVMLATVICTIVQFVDEKWKINAMTMSWIFLLAIEISVIENRYF